MVADHTRLKQVLLNLLSNAIKYNHERGSVTLSCKKRMDNVVRIMVSDTGMGISDHDRKYLFKPFTRLVGEQSDIEGSGIGLSITKQFVELMQGDIGMESELEKGSTFWVDLKIAMPVHGSEGADLTKFPNEMLADISTSDENVFTPKILVVEDNPTNRTVFKYQLEALGYNPEIVASPHEVLAKLKTQPYDLILTDIHMPDMDGYQLVSYIRGLEQDSAKRTPVIAVTANVLVGERKRCIDSGMDDYISKPVDIEVLGHALNYWLGQTAVESAMTHELRDAVSQMSHQVVDLNLAKLGALVGGDVNQQKAIINNYFGTLPGALEEIHSAFKASDAAQLSFWAHRFKSSALTVGAESLAQTCQKIEDFAKDQKLIVMGSLIGELDSLVQRTVKALKEAVVAFEKKDADQSSADAIEHNVDVALVLDDDPVVLHALVAALKEFGVSTVLSATSGSDALALMDKAKDEIDLVLCDLNMPVMDGVEYLRHLVARKYRGGLILLSGEDHRILNSARQLADAHSFHYVAALQKPIEKDQLASHLVKVPPKYVDVVYQAGDEVTAHDLQRAIENDEFVVYYQPKIDSVSKALVGVESLVRWHHPEKNFVMPDQFIPLAEENGMIDGLTDIVIEKVFSQLSRWRKEGLNIGVSINIAVGTIGRRIDFPERLMEFLERYQLGPQDIILELTEGGLMKDIATTLDALVRLRLKGVTLSIDDFGTGYSTFKQLQGIPFSELKIDKEFVMNAGADPSSRAILESSVLLGQKLGMNLVAEGVESKDDWMLLKKLGCQTVQGFYISRPMPGEQLISWLHQWRADSANQ